MDIETSYYETSNHGKKRNQQRGVKERRMNLVISFADVAVSVGNSCTSLSVSNKRIKSLVEEGRLCPQEADKMKNLVVVAANDNDEPRIVTILHAETGKRGRHYRKSVKRTHNRSKKLKPILW